MTGYTASKDYIYRNIVGEELLVPIGRQVLDHNGIVVLNETAALLWKELQTPKTFEELYSAIIENYEIDEDTARTDANEFLEYMLSLDAVETV